MDEQIKNNEQPLKLEGKDILALMIAYSQVLLPFVLILAGSFTVVLIFLMRFWLR